jgi:TRAP-type C4-dicarboxylate transport system permease small subunit
MSPFLSRVERLVGSLLVLTLFAMVALTFVDVIGRRFFDKPVYGAHDLTEHLMALIVFAGLPVLTARREHLSIDLLDAWLLKPRFAVWHRLVDVLIAVTLAVIGWEYAVAAHEAAQIKEVSQALNIPRGWVYGLISGACALAAVAALCVRNPAGVAAAAPAADSTRPEVSP